MATTYTLISSNVLSSSAASVTFSSIPATYTDLVLRVSARSDGAAVTDAVKYQINSDTSTNYSFTVLYGNGTGTTSTRESNYSQAGRYFYASVNGGSTANTFGNGELYIPNYVSSQNKQISEFGVNENNSTTASLNIGATYWRNTAVINTITLSPYNSSNFVSGSSFYLYGISNA